MLQQASIHHFSPPELLAITARTAVQAFAKVVPQCGGGTEAALFGNQWHGQCAGLQECLGALQPDP